jgi:hypothetical protein
MWIARPIIRGKYDAWRAAREAKLRAAKAHEDRVRVERVIRTYSRPRDWIAFEDGRAGDRLLALDSGYFKVRPWYSTEQWPSDFRTPVAFKPREQFAIGWDADSATIFLGQRYRPDGAERLVFVCYLFQGQGRTPGDVKKYGFRLMFRGGATGLTDPSNVGSKPTSGELAEQVYVNLPYGSRLRMYWAQPDPSDRTRFDADYQLNGIPGRIHWKLTMKLLDIESADGPLEAEFRADRERKRPWMR